MKSTLHNNQGRSLQFRQVFRTEEFTLFINQRIGTLENLLLLENNQAQVCNRTNNDSTSARFFPQKSLAVNAVTASNIEHNWPLESIKASAQE